MIVDLVRAGRRVGVTAGSHKVIRNLLDEVVRAAAEAAVAPLHAPPDRHRCRVDAGVEFTAAALTIVPLLAIVIIASRTCGVRWPGTGAIRRFVSSAPGWICF